ncbi:hypothetical protein AMELA_G00077740 [Ameiurus melas]|uniref:Uncharacterized protein n=1 Tax=Ameiurus melas TaxID=219545 RepID=A0A7J6AYP6_AMEME|nr:hypothetical protein AMELA_G00077740 [Ameiurus melas]
MQGGRAAMQGASLPSGATWGSVSCPRTLRHVESPRLGIEPPTLRLVDNLPYQLRHSRPLFAGIEKVTGNLESIPGSMGHKAGDTLDEVPVHRRVQSYMHSHTLFIHYRQFGHASQPTMHIFDTEALSINQYQYTEYA